MMLTKAAMAKIQPVKIKMRTKDQETGVTAKTVTLFLFLHIML